MSAHIKVIGWLHIVMGALGLIGGLVVATVIGGVAAFSATPWLHSIETDAVPGPLFVVIALGVLFLAVILSVPSLIVGIGLVLLKPWSRIPAVILSGFHLLNFPLGTALGAYGLWALLSPEGEAVFRTPL